MLALIYFLLFEGAGVAISFFMLPKKNVVTKAWLGLTLGLGLMMWLPALCAFICGFTVDAHLLAMLPLFLAVGAAWFCRAKDEQAGFEARDKRLLLMLACTALPLTVIGAYLYHTHYLLPDEAGNLFTRMTTYGDMLLHTSIAAGTRNMAFPPEYVILPGEVMNYPFLSDTLSTTFMLFGWDLRTAMMVPGILMMALTFSGYMILAERMAETKKGAVLAMLLFFLNGGLGFMYLVDMQGVSLGSAGNNELQSAVGLWERIKAVLGGWYQTPANHAEFSTYNLRCSNVIVDMMLPQRTTLGGWTMLLPCIYLLYDFAWPENVLPLGVSIMQGTDGPTSVFTRRQVPVRQLVLLGVMAGMLPMINTHCFLGLGLMSAGWLAFDCIKSRKQLWKTLQGWLLYGGIAVVLAAPQLFLWTFSQAVGNESFLTFQFNWVNGQMGMQDSWLWFWIKNVGLPFVLILLSLLEKNEKRRFIASGAFVIFILAEFVKFQPNIYDNYKLFCIWYMLCAVLAADYGFELLGKLRGMRAKPVIAVMALICFFFTGVLAVATEVCTNDWMLFSKADVEAAAFVEEKTDEDDVFMTGTHHINLISSLAGRKIICGPDLWLHYHGYNTNERKEDIRAFYADPAGNEQVLEKYSVDYVVASSHEYGQMTVNKQALDALYDRVYESEWEDVVIWKVGE